MHTFSNLLKPSARLHHASLGRRLQGLVYKLAYMTLQLTRAVSPACVMSLSSIPAPCKHWDCQLGTKVKGQ